MSRHKVILVFHWFAYSGLVYWENLSNPVRFQGNSTGMVGPSRKCNAKLCLSEWVTTLTEDLKAFSWEGWC